MVGYKMNAQKPIVFLCTHNKMIGKRNFTAPIKNSIKYEMFGDKYDQNFEGSVQWKM